jgi:outer membrane protein OmpA-like peptidoglycan-associated protein
LLALLTFVSTRAVLEAVGSTDEIGTKPYNNVLSQKRAEEVARYLVRQNVPLKDISVIGLGEEQTPEQLAAEVQGFDPNASPSQLRALARRARIRMWVPGGATPAAAAAGERKSQTAGTN